MMSIVRHPEAEKGEVFLTNIPEEGFAKCGWETKRMGFTAYDAAGRRMTTYTVFPLFVQRSELTEAGFSFQE